MRVYFELLFKLCLYFWLVVVMEQNLLKSVRWLQINQNQSTRLHVVLNYSFTSIMVLYSFIFCFGSQYILLEFNQLSFANWLLKDNWLSWSVCYVRNVRFTNFFYMKKKTTVAHIYLILVISSLFTHLHLHLCYLTMLLFNFVGAKAVICPWIKTSHILSCFTDKNQSARSRACSYFLLLLL